MSQKRNNVRKYRKPLNINIGLIIFGIIFIYIMSCVILYVQTEPIIGYEVQMGTLSVDNIHEGIILRDEIVIACDSAGYVNYYAQEGERVAVGDLIYSLDESGHIADMINSGELGENSLSSYDYLALNSDIKNFKQGFSNDNFSSIYDFKRQLTNNVLKLSTQNILLHLTENNVNEDLIQKKYASNTGIITYNIDGYEDNTPETITLDDFNKENYNKKQLLNNEILSIGDTAYKIADNEIWTVIFPLEPEQAQELVDEDYVKVKFMKNQESSWAKVSAIQNGLESFVQLDFNNSMMDFSTDRFINFELITEEDKGLKVPNTSIIEKEFYLIPIEYKIFDSDGLTTGFLKQTYLEDGTQTTTFIETEIYYESDNHYYVDNAKFNPGDIINNLDSTNTYTISKKDFLTGVYHMDKGYADFKQIIVLYQNEEYSVIKSNTQYGLTVYDHIVLDAIAITDDEFIYD